MEGGGIINPISVRTGRYDIIQAHVENFNYVKDTAHGFISIAESDNTIGEEINIATQKEITKII